VSQLSNWTASHLKMIAQCSRDFAACVKEVALDVDAVLFKTELEAEATELEQRLEALEERIANSIVQHPDSFFNCLVVAVRFPLFFCVTVV